MTAVGRPSTEVYRQSIEKLPRAVWTARRRAVVHFALAVAILVALVMLIPAEPGEAVDRALILATLAVFASPYVMWRAGRRVRRYWNAFELSIGGEAMRVAAKGAGRVSIRRDEVAEITEGTDGLEVTPRAGAIAHVPTTVEGYGDARARLATWSPLRWRVRGLRWCVGLVALAVVLGGVLFLVRRAMPFAGAFAILHADASLRVVGELRANPGLSLPAKVLWAAVALGSTLLLLGVAAFVALARS